MQLTVIDKDLAPWRDGGGIDVETTLAAVKQYTTMSRQKGIHLGFYEGKAYVIEATLDQGLLGHHANIM